MPRAMDRRDRLDACLARQPRRAHSAAATPTPGTTSTGEGLRLIPLETLDRRGYRPNAEGIAPPWHKDVYRDPESEGS